MKICVDTKGKMKGTRVYLAFKKDKDILFFEAALNRYKAVLKKRGFSASKGQTYYLQSSDILFVGLGDKDKYSQSALASAAYSAARTLEGLAIKEATIDLRGLCGDDVFYFTRSLVESHYDFVRFRSQKEDKKLKTVRLFVDKEDKVFAEEGYVVGESVNYVRDVNNLPPNIATPMYLAGVARRLAKEEGLRFSVLRKKDMERLGFGAYLAVARGSSNEPAMPILEYRAKGAKKTVVFVGKGLTFDSGGLSLKPSKGMDEMKYDKSGACALLGLMRAVARLKPKVNVVAVLAFAENMPDGGADRPSDIVKTHSGKYVEILNTDAEGRLVLADALSYASKRYKPDYMIDYATLTGACVVALGSYAAGLFSNDDDLADLVEAAGCLSGDKVWLMPLWDEYKEMMKSKFADLKNISGTGEAGAITAAAFLSEFVGDTKWAHVDIAGTAWRTKQIPPIENGATGFGVALGVKIVKMLEG